MQAFAVLGDRVAARWRAANHDERAFPGIAGTALAESNVLTRLSAGDVIAWTVGTDTLPSQFDSGFGQPPVVVYRGANFFIEALFWFDATTAIHQHGFSGAFGVLEGSSVHTTYAFEMQDRITSRICLGDVRFRSCEILDRGAVREITAGRGSIHALFHLDRPSVSIVVRTETEPDSNPQYSYLRPSLAYDPFYEPEPMVTQLRVLEATKELGGDVFLRTARTLLQSSDFWMTFKVLWSAYRFLEDGEAWLDLEAVARQRFGPRVDALRHVLAEHRRQQNITARRDAIQQAGHRFFLALLLNVPTREGIYRLISSRYPDRNPQELIVNWVAELADRKLIGLDFDSLSLLVFEYALSGASLDDVRQSLAAAFSPQQVEREEGRLRQLWEEIMQSVLLGPLFAS